MSTEDTSMVEQHVQEVIEVVSEQAEGDKGNKLVTKMECGEADSVIEC